MNQITDFIQKESFAVYKKQYSKKYIKENIIPIIEYINLSDKNKFLFSGSQGIGKSSLIKIISKTLYKIYGKRVLSLSLDDYYLSKKERLVLSSDKHNLLITRGVPGTHRIQTLLNDIKKFDNSIYPIKIPLFDKLTDDIVKNKKIIRKKSDILILEGWCCGCSPIKKEYLHKNINILEMKYDKKYIWRNFYNKKLQTEYKNLFNLFSEKIFIKAPSFQYVLKWRLKQELNNKSISIKSKRMKPNEIKTFIQHFEKITKWMIKDYTKKANLVIKVNKDQKIFSIKSN